LKPGKTYSCFFKNQNPADKEGEFIWMHYDDEKMTTYSSWFDLISICLKNCEFPVLVFYQIQQKYSESEKELSNEEIQTLERYARNADNLANVISNRFRSYEDIINYENVNLNNRTPSANVNMNPINSKSSTSLYNSKHNSNNNSNSRIDQLTEYSCLGCSSKNRIECPICFKCNRNNESLIEDLLKKRGMNNFINIANFNVNINTGNTTGNNLNIPNNAGNNLGNVMNTELIEKDSLNNNQRDSKASTIKKGVNMPNPFINSNTENKKTKNFVEDPSTDEDEKTNNNNRNKSKIKKVINYRL
jgi:hypothetical protein